MLRYLHIIKISIAYNFACAGVDHDLPWIMLMSGANCYSQDYSFLQHQLAGQGYLVAVVDQLHPAPLDLPYVSREYRHNILHWHFEVKPGICNL